MINNIIITKLSIHKSEEGDLLHGLRNTDHGFQGFEEIYFSKIAENTIKGWKMHTEMTLNLIVPIGRVRFNFIESDDKLKLINERLEIDVHIDNYVRITVPPRIIFAFKGIGSGVNMITNVANLIHRDDETQNIPLERFEFK